MVTLIGSLIFSIVVPGTFLLLIPYLLVIAEGPVQAPLGVWTDYLGLLISALGICIYLGAMVAFLTRGKGTPSPTAPPVHFVVSGPYRYVRNPMYLSGMILLLGEAIYFRSACLQVYMGVFSAAFHTFVVRYEEPHLRQRFGAEYERYLASVPRWGPSVKLFKLG